MIIDSNLKTEFNKVIAYSQNIPNPQTDDLLKR